MIKMQAMHKTIEIAIFTLLHLKTLVSQVESSSSSSNSVEFHCLTLMTKTSNKYRIVEMVETTTTLF